MEIPLHYRTALEMANLLRSGKISAAELMAHHLQRARETENRLNAFISWDAEDALQQARLSDERRQKGECRSPWDGIPVALKDLISVRGQPLSCGSKMMENYVSPYDASVVASLRGAGMVVWGRTNLDEFAMGSSTENSIFGPTANPWNVTRVPGGSSGGSAASVAAGQTPLSLGTDTGGSIRQPSAFCGITGLKPTYGRVSRYGVTAFASSLDQVGPMGRSVEDVALLLEVLAGWDARDSTSMDLEVPPYLEESRQQSRWRIGIPEAFLENDLEADVEKAVQRAISFYEKEGCEIIPLQLRNLSHGIAAYYIIATAEAFSNLARFDGVRYGHRSTLASDAVDIYFKSRGEGFGAEVKRRIMLGAFVLSGGYYDAYYSLAQKVRALIHRDYLEAFETVDIILTPTAPTAAFVLGGNIADPLTMYLNDIYTVTVNLAGLPAISLPCGFTAGGLPVGLQLIGRPFGESTILGAANFFQKNHDFHLCHPKL